MSTDTLPATEAVSDLTLGTGAVEGAEAEVAPVERPAPVIRGKIDRFGAALGTGRRKTAVARVRITDGSGKITVNGREFKEFVTLVRDQHDVLAPLRATNMAEAVDIAIQVNGGGPTGQTGAMVLGIARALEAKNPQLHATLAEGKFLSRDGRAVERKKYGHKKARRSFQFSKR
ncbi:30S ribosomal protein S9 [Planctomyces sp. SH-PL14]|uniref:30S ribosomal protein S9 n=1 Tax=Planctomyces sp. SH-PL14 TaxID=1632864 RepID=UPI00078BE5B5|nr:30S ribosomal protein S9 [Planctomyces sp. SH-PL14]AMV21364.1 30S ribosomal protein S9 [Planctomyces sp. SH-PL14]